MAQNIKDNLIIAPKLLLHKQFDLYLYFFEALMSCLW